MRRDPTPVTTHDKTTSFTAILTLISALLSAFLASPALANDFPTRARAEYVFACMSSNGESEVMLIQCSCAVDVIAELMSYDEYVDAETTVRMRLLSGDRTAMFRDVEWVRKSVEKLRAAQAEAEIRCF